MTHKTVRETLMLAIGANAEDMLAFESIVRLGTHALFSQSHGKWAGVVERIHIGYGPSSVYTFCKLRPNSGAGSWHDEPSPHAKFCETCLALALHKDPEWRRKLDGAIG